MTGTSTECGGWELLLGVGGASAATTRLGRPVRIGLCAQYIKTNVDPELTEAVHTAAATLAKAAGQYEVVVCINTPDVLNRARLQRR